MSRTDKDRPYRVRANDPHEKRRYWAHETRNYWNTKAIPGNWELDIYPVNRPPRDVRRSNWGSDRVKKQSWSRNARFHPDIEPPEGRHKHGMLWMYC